MTNESVDGTPPILGALIDERAVEMAIEARDTRVHGELTTSELYGDLSRFSAAIVREDVANHDYEDAESAQSHRQEAIRRIAEVAGRSLRVLANLLAHTCRQCGCTDEAGCPEGCTWIEPGLCSSCAPGADPDVDPIDDYDRTTHFQAAIAAITPEAG